MDTHSFSLDSATISIWITKKLEFIRPSVDLLANYLLELVLALGLLVVVSRWMPCLDTLRILRCIWQCQQLLLQFSWNVDRCKMGALASTVNLVVYLRSEENALLGWLRGNALILIHVCGGTTCITDGWIDGIIDCKGAVDISACLVELNGLPRILSSLTNSRPIWDSRHIRVLLLLLILLRLVLWVCLDVPFNLILSKSQWQVELERIVLTTLRLLEASRVRCSCSGAAVSCPSWIGRVIVVWRSICRCSGCWWEEGSLGTGLIGCLVHFILDVSGFSDRVSKLNYKVVIQVIFIGRLGLFSNSGADNFTFNAFSTIWCSCSWGNSRWRYVLESIALITFVLNCICISTGFWHFWATLSLLLSSHTWHFNCLGTFRFLLIYLHRLVEFFLDNFSRWRFYIFKCDWLGFLRSSLRVESFTFLIIVTFMSWEGFTHVSISLILLIDEMIGSCDMIVSVSFKASDGILFLELKVSNQAIKKVLCVWHLLETREKAWLTRFRKEFFLSLSHVDVVSDLRDANARIWVGIQDFADEVLAFGGEKFRHLIISAHDLFVQVWRLWIFKRQVSGNHSVENDSWTPDIGLKSVIPLTGDHLIEQI